MIHIRTFNTPGWFSDTNVQLHIVLLTYGIGSYQSRDLCIHEQ
jgi:hypothetical protein